MKFKLASWTSGFKSGFFKHCTALDFFKHARILNQVNTNNLVLTPKTQFPKEAYDFGFTPCSNVIYICISELLCNWPSWEGEKIQCTFDPARELVHNVMLYKEIRRGDYRKNGAPS